MFGVCMRLLCACVVLCAADHSSKESYRLWKMIMELKKRPGPWMGWKSRWKKIVGKVGRALWEQRKTLVRAADFSNRATHVAISPVWRIWTKKLISCLLQFKTVGSSPAQGILRLLCRPAKTEVRRSN
jgi:hypothetical protein